MVCDSPLHIPWIEEGKYIPIPCGKCSPCIQRRIDSWVFRLLEEDRISSSSHFVTLTYAPEYLPYNERGFPTLKKRHWQLFMKRLRKEVATDFPSHPKLRYYGIGEYGETYRRPHYHALLYNVPSVAYYSSAWSYVSKQTKEKTQFGLVHTGSVSGGSIAYCVGYMNKAQKKLPWPGSEKEFAVHSRGLGASYLTEEVIKYHRSHPNDLFLTVPGGKKIAMPRYYRNKIWNDQERSDQIPFIRDALAANEEKIRRQCEAKGLSYERLLASDKETRRRLYHMKINTKKRSYE